MKNSKHLLLSILLLLIGNILFAQNLKYDRAYFKAFPDYHEVASAHFAAFTEDYESRDFFLELEKRYDGWFVIKKSYEKGNNIIERTQIWDAQKQAYLFELSSNQSPSANRISGNYEYYIYPLYGYEEASKDCTELLTQLPLEELQAEELEALARAYENMAYGNFRRQGPSPLDPFDSSLNVKDIPAQLIANAEQNAWKSIEIFKYLAKKHPEHLTMVGDLKTKLANSYLFHFMMFQSIQQPEIASKFIKKAKYSREMIAYSKNILKSCPKDAILITYGDNDSYPIWYLQHQKGYRTDVQVLNMMQLLLARYIHYNRKLIKIGTPPEMSLDMTHYKASRNNFCMVEKAQKELSSHLNYIQANQKYSASEERIKFPSSTYLIQGEDSIHINLANNFIYKNELVILDLIGSNWPKRPFCTVAQKSSTLYNALRPYLRSRGLVQILQTEAQINDSPFPELDVAASEELVLKVFQWAKAPKEEAKQQALLPTRSNLQYLYYRLIIHQLEEGNKAQAKKLFLSHEKKQIFQAIPSGIIHLYLALIAQKLELEQNKNAHLEAYMLELEAALKKAKAPAKTAYERCYPAQDEATIHLKITEAINFCRLQDWDDWVKTYQNKFKH
jgi:hypothetical protein